MDVDKIKKLIDAAEERYQKLSPVTKKTINVGGGALAGGLLGSISLGKNSSGKKRGYLLAGDSKTRSIMTGALAGAMAGNHIPVKKVASDENNNTAGIGSWNNNALGRAESMGPGEWVTPSLDKYTPSGNKKFYFPKLLENAKKSTDSAAALAVLNGVAPRVYPGEYDHDITYPELEGMRAHQADLAASVYFGGLDGVRRYLIERGGINHGKHLYNQKVDRAPVDMQRLNQLLNGKKLTPKQLKTLESIQNSMAMRGLATGGKSVA